MIANVHVEEGITFRVSLEGRPNDGSTTDDTMLADVDIGQIAADHTVGLDDSLAGQFDIVTAA